ncbi:entericidin A/B family lipoprotein [Marinobacterium litorale]|nr:entericidin A/B family lipoprotein [Marinobacterium litorale]
MSKLMMAALSSLVMVISLGISGCNTIEGAGQDIEKAGDAIEDAAEDAK